MKFLGGFFSRIITWVFSFGIWYLVFWWFRHLDAMENGLEKSGHGRHTGFHPKVVSWVLIHMLLLFLMLLFFVVYMLFFSKCAAKFSTATAALPGCVDSP
jgi:hypothetical protein